MDFSMFENMKFGNDIMENFSNMSFKKTMSNNNNISHFPEDTPLAMAYVPMQQWSETYDDKTALETGTIFPELNLPFNPQGGCYE